MIKDLLAEHGRQFATVKPTYERIAATNAVKLVFNIDEGPKVKVGEITIVGNKAFSTRKIIRTMKQRSALSRFRSGFTDIPIMSKTFDQAKAGRGPRSRHSRPLPGPRLFQGQRGHEPDLKTVDVNRGGIPGPWPGSAASTARRPTSRSRSKRATQYRMGKLTFRSADPDQGLIFKSEFLANGFFR